MVERLGCCSTGKCPVSLNAQRLTRQHRHLASAQVTQYSCNIHKTEYTPEAALRLWLKACANRVVTRQPHPQSIFPKVVPIDDLLERQRDAELAEEIAQARAAAGIYGLNACLPPPPPPSDILVTTTVTQTLEPPERNGRSRVPSQATESTHPSSRANGKARAAAPITTTTTTGHAGRQATVSGDTSTLTTDSGTTLRPPVASDVTRKTSSVGASSRKRPGPSSRLPRPISPAPSATSDWSDAVSVASMGAHRGPAYVVIVGRRPAVYYNV